MNEKAPKMSKAEAGRLGGMATRRRHGTEHYRTAGRKGAETTLARYGIEHMRQIGKAGFHALAGKYGHFNVHDVQSGRSRALDQLVAAGKIRPRQHDRDPAETARACTWADRVLDQFDPENPRVPLDEEPDPLAGLNALVDSVLASIRSAPLPADGGL